MVRPFRPGSMTPLSIAATTAGSDRVQLTKTKQVRIDVAVNATASIVYINIGTDNTVTAATTNFRMYPGMVEVLELPPETAYIAARTDTGTASVFITPGEGI